MEEIKTHMKNFFIITFKEGSEFKAVREKNIKRDVGGKFSP